MASSRCFNNKHSAPTVMQLPRRDNEYMNVLQITGIDVMVITYSIVRNKKLQTTSDALFQHNLIKKKTMETAV